MSSAPETPILASPGYLVTIFIQRIVHRYKQLMLNLWIFNRCVSFQMRCKTFWVNECRSLSYNIKVGLNFCHTYGGSMKVLPKFGRRSL